MRHSSIQPPIHKFWAFIKPIHLLLLAKTKKIYLLNFSFFFFCFCSFFPFLASGETGEFSHAIINDSILTYETVQKRITNNGSLTFPTLNELEIHLTNPLEAQDTIFFQLEEFDKTWNYTFHPVIRYTNISKGKYKLVIYTAKNPERLSIPIQIEKESDIFNTWWFKPLLTFWLLLIPFTLFYFLSLDRSRRNLRIEIVRNQIARDLHDDVGANLSAIQNLAETLKIRIKGTATEKNEKIINHIESYTKETKSKLDDTVWAINPNNDSIEVVLSKMKDISTKMIQEAKDMTLEFSNQFCPPFDHRIDIQQRHNLFLMFKETLNNIIKHAQAKTAKVTIQNTKNSIIVEVEDNGVGFDSSKGFSGNGLKNFKSRAEENFIKLEVNSILGKGTRIRMEVFSLS